MSDRSEECESFLTFFLTLFFQMHVPRRIELCAIRTNPRFCDKISGEKGLNSRN